MGNIKNADGKKLNETATYNKLAEDEQDFDNVPDNFYATKSGYPIPQNQNLTMEEEEVNPEEEDEIPGDEPPPPPPEGEEGMGEPEADVEEEKTVNELQNEIIKYNTETLKSIHTEIERLNSTITSLNSKVDNLNADVEEVREPTNVEKLVQQKDVSYPYYFHLNDFWKKDNKWFDNYGADETENKIKGEFADSGIKKLPDGSYVADFDDLPKDSFIDIEKSFHDVV